MTMSNFIRALAVVFVFLPAASARAFLTDDPPYLKAVAPSATITPLLTVGETVPRTSNPAQSFRLIGLANGIGATKDAKGHVRIFLGHALRKTDVSQPIAGTPLSNGAFVSELLVQPSPPDIASADLAATTILDGKSGQPRPGAPGRFGSGFLADQNCGFDRPVFLTGEKDAGGSTFDGRGGQDFALVEGIAYPLPDLGRFQKQETVVVSGSGLKTVALILEDGPGGYHSQLYLYVGEKNLSSKSPLERNGLVGGSLYVFTANAVGMKDEGNFHKLDHAISGRWVKIQDAASKTDAALDNAAVDAGAFLFDHLQDGAYDRLQNGVFYFATRGGDTDGDRKGRLYRLNFDPQNPPAGRVILEIVLEGDAGDPILQPSHIDMNASGEMLVTESFTTKNPSVWLYRPGSQGPVRLAEVSEKSWEPGGVADVSGFFGPGSWLVTVQAHTVGSAEASRRQKIEGDGYVAEGGQLLLIKTLR